MTPPTLSEEDALRALGGLAQPQRLRAFRLLVAAGPQGLAAGAIAEKLGVAPSALSFHLKALSHAGLVQFEPLGRFVIYRAHFRRMTALLAYLTEHCCELPRCEC